VRSLKLIVELWQAWNYQPRPYPLKFRAASGEQASLFPIY